jgi:HK97 family phage prohead protease
MQTKHSNLELKVDAQGTFTGLLSPYNVRDNGSDVVVPGAFAKNIAQKGNVRPLLFAHETAQPVGTVTLDDRADGLWVRGELLLDIPDGKKAYRLLQAKVITGLSIGYRTIKEDFSAGVRYLRELALYEASLVLFPMNEAALIESVKAAGQQELSLADVEAIGTEILEYKRGILAALEKSYGNS